MRTAGVLLLALLVPQAREASPSLPVQGTATLLGTVVTDDATNAPVRRALITVLMTADSRQQFQVSTDETGRFSVPGLPRGNATVIASKPAYVTTYYGATQPGSTMGVPVALADGQNTTVTIRLPRGGVIAGTVHDERGQPMPSVGVRVRRLIMSASGQRQLVSPTVSALIPATDDRGAYRIFGLPAGAYVVSALPRLTGGGEIRPPTQEELQWAERQIRSGPQTSLGPTAPPPSPGRSVAYATVYHPATVDVANAGVIALGAGQERGGIDLRMQFVTTARVQGHVTQPDGQPASGMQVLLIPKIEVVDQDAARLAGLVSVGLVGGPMSRAGPDGKFELQGVEPGDYVLMSGNLATGRAGVGAPSPTTLWAMSEIRVDGRDVTGVSLKLAPGQNASGRFVFEGKSAPVLPARVSLSLRATEPTGYSVAVQLSVAGASDPFNIPGMVPSTYRFSATMAGWILKSAKIGERDVTDRIFEIKPGEDLSNLVVTFNDAPAEVTGVLYDAANRATSDLSMVLFSTSRELWFNGSRHTRPAVRPSSDGRFTFSGLAPGEYFLAALTEVSPNDLMNAQFLDQVAAAAIKVSLVAGEKKTQDLRIAR